MPESHLIRGLPVPRLLLDLVGAGRWRHPGDDVLGHVLPFAKGPIEFLPTLDDMAYESSSLDDCTAAVGSLFREHRGSRQPQPSALPWLDVERAFFLAVGQTEEGDDVAIALDFRTGDTDPRVVANLRSRDGVEWREVSPTFTVFAQVLGL